MSHFIRPLTRSVQRPLVLPLSGSGVYRKFAEGVTPAPPLDALTVSPSSATVGQPFNGTVSGKTAGSMLSLSGPGAAGLSITDTNISGTPTAFGAVNVVETLAGAAGSPRTSAAVASVASNAGTGPLTIAFIGSSTPQRYFTDYTGPENANVSVSQSGTAFTPLGTTGGGATRLGDILATRLGRPIRFIRRGLSGTTLADWEAEGSSNRSGAVAAMIAGGVDLLVSIVGFNDADQAIVQSEAAHLAKLRSLFNKFRTEIGKPSLPVVVGTSQKLTSSNAASNQQIVMVRSAELTVSTDSNVRFGAHSLDLAQLPDNVHQAETSYPIHAARLAEAIISVVTGSQQPYAPRIMSATAVSSTQTDVTLDLRSATDFAPASAITGFELSSDDFATIVLPYDAVRTSQTSIRLTHGAVLANAKLRYLDKAAPDLTGIVKGNTAVDLMTDYTGIPLSFVANSLPPRGAIAVENFNGTNGSVVTSRAADTGELWTALSGNLLLVDGAAYANSSNVTLQLGITPTSPEYDIEATINLAGQGSQNTYLTARAISASSYYYAGYSASAGWIIGRSAPSNATLASSAFAADAADHVVKFQVRGAKKSLFVDGVEVCSTTDNVLPSIGKPGFRNSGAASSASGPKLKDYKVTYQP